MACSRPAQHESSMHDFREAVKECKMKAICGRHFIRVDKLKAWVSSNMERLLDAAYYKTMGKGHPTLPITKRKICSSQQCILLIFCILLEMDRGDLVHYFHQFELHDSHLKHLDSPSLKKTLERSDLSSREDFDLEQFAKDFATRRWPYCPVRFELEDRKIYNPHQIIPIHKKEAINDKGFTASVWQVEVLEEFIGPQMKTLIATSRYNDVRDGLGQRYVFAQKTFEEGKRSFFEDEVKAFDALEGHEGFIRYLGDYSQRDFFGEKNSYNILLEFGERDLDEFFFDRRHLPPVLPVEMCKFWAEIFAIADAVKNIHSFKKKREGLPREFYGWHADIKPDNILQVKGKFKLADPGFACFEWSEGVARLGNREQTTHIRGGTTTYGAPECHPGRKERSPVPRSIDIWSLGCVFSVTATWVVLGEQGIRQFTTLRERNVREKIEQAMTAKAKPVVVALQPGDYFHDGETVLESVLGWHNLLRKIARKTDTITSKLLDLVDGHMLREKADDRISAEDLCLNLSVVLSQQQPTDPLLESLQRALVQIHMSAPSAPTKTTALLDPRPAALGDDAIQDRKTRKSRLLDLPLVKTAHPSEVLSVMPEDGSPPVPPLTHIPNHDLSSLQAPRQSNSSGSRAMEFVELGTTSHQRPPQLNPPPMRSSSVMQLESLPSSPEPKKQNLFQVLEEMKRRKSVFGKYPKDPEMTKYFGDRDIQFLIDNADSMADHWAEAKFLLEALTVKACGQDEDGMDLCFTHGNVIAKGKKRPGDMIEKMNDLAAKPNYHHGYRTDIRKKLEVLFRDYLHYLSNGRNHDKPVRKLVIIIFTDGKWEGMTNKHDIESTIVEFVNKMKAAQSGYLDDRQVSFSFIQFGNDEDARYRLQRLDDELESNDVPDLVDTEGSRGDVKKMLVGSFDETYYSKNEFKPTSSNSGSKKDSYFELDSRPRYSIFSQDQQSQSPPQMDSAPQDTAYHRRADSGIGHSSPPAAQNRSTAPAIFVGQDSQRNSNLLQDRRVR